MNLSIITQLNVPMLRHTSATLAIKNGTDIHTLKNRLGHENISITSDLYAHLYTGQQQAAAEMMDVYLAD